MGHLRYLTCYTFMRGDDEIEAVIGYNVARYHSAVMPSLSDPGHPAEGGEVTEMEAYNGGDKIEFTDEEAHAAELHIYDNHNYYNYERGL